MSFKYYKTKQLIALIAVLIVIANIIIKVSGPYLHTLISGPIKEEILTIADYIGICGVLGIVGIFLYAINKWLWKFTAFKWLVDIPNLNGRYTGKLISDFNSSTKKDAVIEIKQTASEIKICGYFADEGTTHQTSSSYSRSEVIDKGHNDFFTLLYLYANEPNLTSSQVFEHGGSVSLKYFPDNKTLKGEYYNKRKNHGTLELKFESEQLLGRFEK